MRIREYLINEYGVNTSKDLTEHTHKGEVNEDGDGKTTTCESCSEDHVHKIFQWLVQPASGHTHNLKE
jgi:hypothetical protein